MGMIAEAIAFAAKIHKDQYDKGGEPYILHPLRVMQKMDREDEKVVAVLHDVVEDNTLYAPGYLSQLIEDTFGNVVWKNIDLLSKPKSMDYLGEYIPQIIAFSAGATADVEGYFAAKVKMADLEDNLNPLRQPTLKDKDLQRLQKYHMAYRMLRGET